MSEIDSYIAKWLAYESGMELAQVFCPAPERRVFVLWGALLNELDEAALQVSDASVALAKLAWWGEELARGARGTAQHPLLREFFAQDAARRVNAQQWAALAQAAIAYAQDESRPPDTASALQRHRAYSEALVGIESMLFGATSAPQAIAVHRVLRELSTTHPHWPLHLVARYQLGAEGDTAGARRDYARELLELLRQMRGGSLFRRCGRVLDEARLQGLATGTRGPGRLICLWRLWRAARGFTISP